MTLSGLQRGTHLPLPRHLGRRRGQQRDLARAARRAGRPSPCPQTPEQSLVDSTVADFAAGDRGADTYVGATGSGDDGEVVLRPTVGEEFDGSLLPAGWFGDAVVRRRRPSRSAAAR